MSNSNDTNELDNYGVWVKKPPKDIQPDADNPDGMDDAFALDDALPDFDMPEGLDSESTAADETVAEETAESNADISLDVTEETLDDPFAGVDFSDIEEPSAPEESDTLTSSDFEIEDSEPTVESSDSLTLDDLSIDEPTEENTTEASGDSIDSIDVGDFMADDLNIPEETTETSDVSAESFGTEDVTESVTEPAAAEASAEESSDTTETVDFNLDSMEDGEIDLDNFLSDDSSSGGEETVDVSDFGLSSSDSESVNLDDFLDGGDFGGDPKPKQEEIVEEEPLDINLSFDESANSFEVEEENAESSSDSSDESGAFSGEDVDSESIDLSEFGVEEGEDEAPVKGPEDVINEPPKEIVDYDLKVTADTDDDSSVSMSDIVSGNIAGSDDASVAADTTVESSETDTVVSETAGAASDDSEISLKGQEILQQIVGELASLKDEIKNLKTDFAELKTHDSSSDITIEQNTEENTGFFADSDEDDTIALSGDELDNILNNAEFLDETAPSENAEETAVESSDLSGDTETSETENAPIDSVSTVSNGQFASMIDDNAFDDSTIFDDSADDESLDETEEDINPEISEDLPDEIEIPKVDDFSEGDSFESSEPSIEPEMTSDSETIENPNPMDEIFPEDESSIDSSLTTENLDYIAEDSTNPVSVEESSDSEISLDDDLGDLDLPAPTVDEISDSLDETADETVAEPSFDAEPQIEESEEPVIEETAVTVDSESDKDGEIPTDLKQEIKSVLSYMDQLLENLPEDKISEFAQSEHFVTYKKLFQELGLS
ncbi:hypothetical protein [Treponema sp.]|uniref:hypothetical protein n=1 Tax=Treponema sp. TaxID=166 RepID=UPI00298DCAD4|nr:hypothetical protein [Treponema sp.]MCR5612468.1 hypothetical protein [Treponema sp.]